MATAPKELPFLANSTDRDREECTYLGGMVWRESYLTGDIYRSLIALICILSILLIPTVSLNGLVILVVATKRQLRTNSNKLLACLAGTDLLAGLVVIPIAIAVNVKRAFKIGPFCELEKAHVVVFWVQSIATLTFLFLISGDRYIAVKFSLRYREIVTGQRIKKAVVVAWVITVFGTIQEIVIVTRESTAKLYALYWTVTALFVLLCIIGITFMYLSIYLETQRQKKRPQTGQLSPQEAKELKKDVNNKATVTLSLILGTLVLTYLPAITVASIQAFTNFFESGTKMTLISWTDCATVFNSLSQPHNLLLA